MARRDIRTIGQWAVFLSGPLIWSAHLGFVYAAATVEITLTEQAGIASRIAIGFATLVCLAVISWIGWSVWRGRLPKWETPQKDVAGLWRKSGGLLSLLAFLAVLWQGLPAIFITGQPEGHAALYGGTAPPGPRSR
jgi:hypothetical protein